MQNFFDFFGINAAYAIDKAALKRIYLQKSRENHPDFYSLSSPEEQEEKLRLSGITNEAYATLIDDDKRLAYLFKLFEINGEKLSPAFLGQMMEINEALVEGALSDEVKAEINDLRVKIRAKIKRDMEAFDAESKPDLQKIALQNAYTTYLELKYILRIEENSANFATS